MPFSFSKKLQSPNSEFTISNTNSTSSFDTILTALENVILSPEFDEKDTEFLEKHLEHFDTSENGKSENKLIYTEIFKQYEKFGDDLIITGLKNELGDLYNENTMAKFQIDLEKNNIDGCLDEIQEMLKCFTSFEDFKNKIIDYKKFKNGEMDMLTNCLTVTTEFDPDVRGLDLCAGDQL